MNKSKTGIILGVLSLLPVLVSIISFYVLRGPNASPTPAINIFILSSITGIILACISLKKSNKFNLLIGVLGLILNLLVLAGAFLLMLAYGMSEN